jgi:hypothetical protein
VLGSIDAANVMELLEASRRLQVGVAEAQCCEWLANHLDVSNAMVVWESARRLGCEAVQAKAWPVVGRHLQEVARHESFLMLPQMLLVELLSDDSLAVRSEVTVYEAVMGWVRSDAERRRGAIGEVLRAVRLGRLPAHYLRRVAADPLVIPNTDAKRLLVEVSCAMYRRRDRCVRHGSGLIVVGGWNDVVTHLLEPECYDELEPPGLSPWRALPPIPPMRTARYACAAASADGLLFVLGGGKAEVVDLTTTAADLRSATSYDPSTGMWTRLPNMLVERHASAATSMGGLVYVVGGLKTSDNNGTASAECYDPSILQWRRLPDMSVKRYWCAAACVNDVMYVVGGFAAADGTQGASLSSAESYDPVTGTWQTLPSMSVARYGCAAGCVDGRLYVVGGAGAGNSSLASAECYDPAVRQWHALPSMSTARGECAAACVDGLLYVMGGTHGPCNGRKSASSALASAECYDACARQWRALPDMRAARRGCAAVAIP